MEERGGQERKLRSGKKGERRMGKEKGREDTKGKERRKDGKLGSKKACVK